ncbi:MAG: proline dehydrogenase family protein [Planctomycetota bacterium]
MAFFKKTKPAPGTQPATFHADAARQSREASGTADPAIFQIGQQLLDVARKHPDPKGVKDKLADWAMQDEAFKVQLFRFVDVFPRLGTPEQVHQHLIEYLSNPPAPGMPDPVLPPGLGLGLKAGGIMKGTLAKTMASQITGMGEKFIAGEDAATAIPDLRKLWKRNIAFSVDLLGEACVSEAEAAVYRERYMDLITGVSDEVKDWTPNPQLETDHLGPIPRANVSIKVSSLVAKFDPLDFDRSVDACYESLKPLLEEAGRRGVLINFDVEQSELKELNLALFMRCCENIDFQAGLAMQAYLKSGDNDAQRVIDWSKRTGREVTVRLVKGAYWDAEVISAQEHGWPIPVWTRKQDSDACFERMAARFVEHTPRNKGEGGVKLALGSHNLRSIASVLHELDKHNLPHSALELQMLYGMGNGPKQAALTKSLRLREYIPVGEMIPGMAYLVRRLLENTSNESWLMKGFDKDTSAEELLASPHRSSGQVPGDAPTRGVAVTETAASHAGASNSTAASHAGDDSTYDLELIPGVEGVGDGSGFFTEPFRDFSVKEQRDAFAAAIDKAQVPQVANDGTVAQASDMVGSALAAFPRWRDRDPIDRANMLIKAADLMRARRDELSGIIIKEAGKPWKEADGDVCEAIDFCDYYARLAPGMATPKRLGDFIGEDNRVHYEPRGVAVVISPWNFPLAIATGMTAAALVTGNTAVLKPAEQTPGIAKVMADIFWEAGVPKDVLHFLPAPGETVGAALVRDPRIALIAFTGSKAVGLDIIQAAGVTPETQPHVKQVVCEMGGKNAVIIDSSADLDEAVLGVRYSAFGFSGQKCSACSRVVILDDVYDEFVRRFVESTKSLSVGDPIHPGTDVGTVIDAEARDKIMSYVELGSQEGKLELAMQGEVSDAWGKPVVGPHIFSGITQQDRLACEEIFGPVVALIRVKSFDEALQVANSTPYRLTGGIFTRTPSHLERARVEFRVGNLYLNRGCTGALVGRQPFGGGGMSGVGSKAGGDQYLYQFVEPRCVTENTMRRGFAPGLMS